jgi:hypothetical protein
LAPSWRQVGANITATPAPRSKVFAPSWLNPVPVPEPIKINPQPSWLRAAEGRLKKEENSMIRKPRRRRVWDNPPETRNSWKRSKRQDLKPGRGLRHVAKWRVSKKKRGQQ